MNNRILTRLGANVRGRRQELGFSQEQLAARCGLHRTYVSSVERGQRNVSLRNLVRLARSLDCELPALLNGIE